MIEPTMLVGLKTSKTSESSNRWLCAQQSGNLRRRRKKVGECNKRQPRSRELAERFKRETKEAVT
jgi:hypothetical protein